MAFVLKSAINSLRNTLLKVSSVSGLYNPQPLIIPGRTKYVDARMVRDVKRRKVIKQYAKLRLQINSLRYNTILPKQLQEIADKEIAALPRDSCLTRSHPRCILTSRARGRWRDFRMSRIIWRHLADYNQISGVERAMWGWS